jgi:hypothetical protein
MSEELIIKMVKGKLDALQNWTIIYSRNIQNNLISENDNQIERNLINVKMELENIKRLRDETLESIINIINSLNNK